MAKLIDISKENNFSTLKDKLSKVIQSANINFLIGSGCSYPAIDILGAKETEIINALDKGENNEATSLLHKFLLPFLENTKALQTNIEKEEIQKTLKNYHAFIKNVTDILFYRKNEIIPSQATVFTTNYDLLIEHCMEDFDSVILCDGFKRTPNINNEYYFSPTEYFNTVFNTGNLYRYKVEIPTINLIKLHGSLNWQKKDGKIVQDLSYLKKAEEIKNSGEVTDFNNLFPIVLPQDNKLKLTVYDEIYYDLLRIYSNELDKENTILIVEGFSFADQHFSEITIRALKNKTFYLVIFCYDKNTANKMLAKFKGYNNVDIVSNGEKHLSFNRFNCIFSDLTDFQENDVKKE